MSRRTRDERGASSVELVLYMPLLMLMILLTVQFSLTYLGRQAAGAVAREAARVARTTGDEGLAASAGRRMVGNIGKGILEDSTVDVDVEGDWVRVTVEGRAQQILLLPFIGGHVSQTVRGPVERFVEP